MALTLRYKKKGNGSAAFTVRSQSAEIPSLSADELATLRQRLTALRDQWNALNPGDTLELSIDL
ncbi:MAG TPA: hypothetical protein VIY49_00100 [Bryobacteraceae bacterium]